MDIYIKSQEVIDMAGPKKSEISQAAKDLANPKPKPTKKSEAAETLNYHKNTQNKKK